MYLQFLMIIALLLPIPLWIEAATKLALHVTQEELVIWKQRALSGPYLDDWNAILTRANSFRSSPESRWVGNTTNVCYRASGLSSDSNPGRTKDANLRDAAFAYLITGDTTYRTPVLKQLLAQAAVPGTDFSDRKKWCTGDGATQGQREAANWVRRLAYGYSYIRAGISATDRVTLDTWFLNAGVYFESTYHAQVVKRFPKRLSDDYSCTGFVCPSSSAGLTHFGGNTVYQFHLVWDNNTAATGATVASVAALVDDANLKSLAQRMFKEHIKYGVFPGGWTTDQRRWGGYDGASQSSPLPYLGYAYAADMLGSLIVMADHLARSGDLSLYNYSTSEGLYGTQGGPKTLLKALQHVAGQTNGTVIQYASTVATSNSAKIIRDSGSGSTRVEFVNLTPANMFYKAATVKTAYTKTLPSSWQGIGCDMLSGEWCSYPRVRFMFGQMETLVNPYSITAPPKPAPVDSFSVMINNGNDHAEESIADGDVRTNPLALELEETQLGGFRFQNLPIPQGSTVTSAIIKFTPTTNPGNVGSPTYRIKVQDSITTAAFVAGAANNNISARTLRAEFVDWSPDSWTGDTINSASTSPNLAPLFQPLVNNINWDAANNAIVVVLTNVVNGQRIVKPLSQGGIIRLTVAYGDPSLSPPAGLRIISENP
jgi:hypothetical protein